MSVVPTNSLVFLSLYLDVRVDESAGGSNNYYLISQGLADLKALAPESGTYKPQQLVFSSVWHVARVH